jgi:7-cyano-7-deazaguanine synthase
MTHLLICSGGLDSITLATKLHNENKLSLLLTFDYNQKHKKEIIFAKAFATKHNIKHLVLDISNIGSHLSNSALTDTSGKIKVPTGKYTKENMQDTVVPNRNAIMLSIAYGICENYKLKAVALAVHGGDHFIYPDCRPEFIDAFQIMQNLALGITDPSKQINIYAPFIKISKADIVKIGVKNKVDFGNTWSCYNGEELHCGECATCLERKEAFALNDITDPTIYKI